MQISHAFQMLINGLLNKFGRSYNKLTYNILYGEQSETHGYLIQFRIKVFFRIGFRSHHKLVQQYSHHRHFRYRKQFRIKNRMRFFY